MLETDEFDENYFTPATNTPLSNIFNASHSKESTNDSLKYTPPKRPVQRTNEDNEEDSKATECILACALTAYEWVDNNYTPKGLLGFALLKTLKNNSHSIILYNANKTTISNATITSKFNMTLKGNNYFSYYDNSSKYWSLYAGQEEIKKITETLQNLGVEIKHAKNTDEKPLEPSSLENEQSNVVSNNSDKESDTDSSVIRKTKASILNRMANMGQSVLPTKNMDKSSDSSDTSEMIDKPINAKTKPKVFAKRTIEKNKIVTCEPDDTPGAAIALKEPLQSSSMYTFLNGHLVPATNSSIINYGHSSHNDMNIFLTEQRVHNNEIRININRNTDKLDQVLEKISALSASEEKRTNSFQTDIMQKLITEYERKIKMYEQLLASNKIYPAEFSAPSNQFNEKHKDEISKLQTIIQEKDAEIIRLNEAQRVREYERTDKDSCGDDNFLDEITILKQCLFVKTQELETITKRLEESAKSGHIDDNKEYESKLKSTMNEAFRIITTNFQNNETYSGEQIKTVLAKVIKKVTIQSLND